MAVRTPAGRHRFGSSKEGAVLAALAFDVNKPVSTDTLIRRVWDEDPPDRPLVSLRSYMSRLRKRLGRAAVPDGPRLTQNAHAYTLETPPDTVDCHRFRTLVSRAAARSADGDDPGALALMREAEALWRGEPLTGIGGTWAETVRADLGERRFAAILARAETQLRTGDFAEVVADLSALAAERPTDETLLAHLMVASYACGRQADALRFYESARRRLSDELGTDPAENLSRVHRLILRQAPVSELISGGKATTRRSRSAEQRPPDNLPRHAELVGREAEMGILADCVGSPPPGSCAVVALQAISGMAGVGKSLLALHAAERFGAHFPDGRIHLNLQAHAPGAEPLTPRAALSSLLRALGVPAGSIPQEPEEAASLWRTLLTSRRAVIVLDDAADAEQVRPLLPGRSSSLVVITSRRRLSGLPGVRPLFLDVLPPEDAVALFRRLVGDERAGDGAQIAEVVRLCGYLPLAVELAAGRLVSRPTWKVSHLIRRMTRGQGRLREIRDGCDEIGRAFEMSYNTLTEDQKRVFRFAGLHFGSEFDLYAAAALTGFGPQKTERILDDLLDAHLVHETAPERYRFHDLLGEYSRTLATAVDSAADRDRALARLAEFCLHAADRAVRLADPRHPRLGTGHGDCRLPLPSWHDPQEAESWLMAERAALIAAERHLREHGAPRRAALLAHTLAGFLDKEGYWPEAQRMHEHAARTWAGLGEERCEARARIDLGITLTHASRYAEAAAAGERALELARAVGDTEAEAEALHRLGLVHWCRGDYRSMLATQQTALELRRKSGDRWQMTRSVNNIGIAYLHLGEHSKALQHFQEALAVFGELGDGRGQVQSLNNVAEAYLEMGDKKAARESFARVFDLAMKQGSRTEQAVAQLNMANTFSLPEEMNQALDLSREALFSFRRLGDRRYEAITMNFMGRALLVAGRHRDAQVHHARALEAARPIGAGLEEAQALCGLGAAEFGAGQGPAAATHLEAALAVARRLHSPKDEAQACALLAEVRLAAGARAEAVSLLRRALEIFERLDPAEAERTRIRLACLRGTRADGTGGLDPG
ncbi:tetratricopeptide repeat protein [Streptomyces sp. S07_1.15]|uniref:AfsR/SARP family transcriptional regulator n=1 Tax=Streptomyces sp. S07_1.15 TaxID=2873925 RepID=UPI001D141993|nr:AfsR/SARP family transcriptional regulator [Streptomyces sp. S07_1.15]MCC3654644.1 tetratricopeptide repeat protein [Streptomyces sp. S07_1.15]